MKNKEGLVLYHSPFTRKLRITLAGRSSGLSSFDCLPVSIWNSGKEFVKAQLWTYSYGDSSWV